MAKVILGNHSSVLVPRQDRDSIRKFPAAVPVPERRDGVPLGARWAILVPTRSMVPRIQGGTAECFGQGVRTDVGCHPLHLGIGGRRKQDEPGAALAHLLEELLRARASVFTPGASSPV
jgi:hypothetical protein